MAEMTSAILQLLRGVPYFAGLPDELLAAIVRVTVERRYSRGETIFLEGESCIGLYVVARGEVKIYKLSSQGREQILHRIGAGGTFNDVAALDGGPNPASAAATADAVLLCIPRVELQQLARAYPALAWVLIETIARRTRHLVEMVEDLALRSVKSRLAKLLLSEAQRGGSEAYLDRSRMVTQAEMAARLGTVREMVGRALRELADDDIIRIDRHRIVIVDRAGLTREAAG